MEKSLRLVFHTSNNEAEYEALISDLRAVLQLRAEEVKVFSNSKLVVSQIKGNFEAMDSCMQQYLKLYGARQTAFQKVSVVRISRSQNSHADSFETLASSLDECVPRMIFVKLLE